MHIAHKQPVHKSILSLLLFHKNPKMVADLHWTHGTCSIAWSCDACGVGRVILITRTQQLYKSHEPHKCLHFAVSLPPHNLLWNFGEFCAAYTWFGCFRQARDFPVMKIYPHFKIMIYVFTRQKFLIQTQSPSILLIDDVSLARSVALPRPVSCTASHLYSLHSFPLSWGLPVYGIVDVRKIVKVAATEK